MKWRFDGVHLQSRLQVFQQGMFQSTPEGETVQLTHGSRSPGIPGNPTVEKQQLRESPPSADVRFAKDLIAADDDSRDPEKNIDSSIRSQACDRCRVRAHRVQVLQLTEWPDLGPKDALR